MAKGKKKHKITAYEKRQQRKMQIVVIIVSTLLVLSLVLSAVTNITIR